MQTFFCCLLLLPALRHPACGLDSGPPRIALRLHAQSPPPLYTTVQAIPCYALVCGSEVATVGQSKRRAVMKQAACELGACIVLLLSCFLDWCSCNRLELAALPATVPCSCSCSAAAAMATAVLERPASAAEAPEKVITSRVYARVGLLGNPSDGFYGKTIAFSLRNFHAEVRLALRPGRAGARMTA